jgi:WASH complex subunit strumpellin
MIYIPMKIEAKDLKNYSQLDLRFELSKLTHQVSLFTEGILVMEKTLLGVIQVDPRQILHQGLKRELVKQIATAMHGNVMGSDGTGTGVLGVNVSGGVRRDEIHI